MNVSLRLNTNVLDYVLIMCACLLRLTYRLKVSHMNLM